MDVLLSTTYFGPVEWYAALYRADRVELEQCENFQKQTYRNRCIIATTHGPLSLTIPVVHGSESMKNLRISDHGNWRHLHWNALATAYGESPFFEYYQDDIRPFFEKRWDYLFDFNEAIRETMCQLLDIQPHVDYTTGYRQNAGGWLDLRTAINPKHPAPNPLFSPTPYYQVYRQKLGFLPNLSILDLLFNMGPEAIFLL